MITLVTLTALGILAAALPAGAGKSSLELVVLTNTAQVASASASPRYGADGTFNVSTDRTATAWVNARCYQNGQLVYDQWHGIFAGYEYDPIFELGPTQLWTGGAATCEAKLVAFNNGTPKTLATIPFNVGA